MICDWLIIVHDSFQLPVQEDAENTKFRMEQQIQLLEADLTAGKLAPPAAGNAAVAAGDSKHSSSAKTAAKLEAVELQLAQMQQQNEHLSADKYDGSLCIAQVSPKMECCCISQAMLSLPSSPVAFKSAA